MFEQQLWQTIVRSLRSYATTKYGRDPVGLTILFADSLEHREPIPPAFLMPAERPPAASGERAELAMFSPLEQQIVQTLGREQLQAKAVAARTRNIDNSGQANTHLRSILNNLVERGAVAHDDAYRLTPAGLREAERLGLLGNEP